MSSKAKTKVLLLGLDAADPALLLEWARGGRLPVLAELIENARVAEMADLPGLWSSAVWPSVATGASPGRHGYLHYHDYDPSTYETVSFRARGYGVQPFWQTLSDADRRVAILDVPLAPLSPSLNGIQLTNWGIHEPEGAVGTRPADLAARWLERWGREPVGQCDFGGRGPADFGEFRDRLRERVRTRAEFTREVVSEGGWDLVFSVFSEPHCVGHQCWHLHDPGHPDHDPAAAASLGDPVLDVYREVDRALGRLLEGLDPETHVFVLATHGMGRSYSAHFLLDRVLQSFESEAVPGSKLFNALYRRWRRMPTSWRVLLRPLGLRARKHLSTNARKNRESFELFTHCAYGAIRVNLAGREPSGRVAAEDFGPYCERLAGRLLELEDPDSGEPLVRDVIRASDHYERKPEDRLPDLIVEWERDVAARAVYSPSIGKVSAVAQSDFSNRTGNHRPSGALFLHQGPGVSPGGVERASTVMDVAPTILRCLGVEPDGLDGRPI